MLPYISSSNSTHVGMPMQQDGLHLTLLLSPFGSMHLHACDLSLKHSNLLLSLGKSLLQVLTFLRLHCCLCSGAPHCCYYVNPCLFSLLRLSHHLSVAEVL